jgi:ferredoxin-NADP reductase
VQLTLPIRDVEPATPRARIVRIDLQGESFPYRPGQALLVGSHGQDQRKAYSIAAAPADSKRERCLELLVGVNDLGHAGAHLTLVPRALVDVEGPLGGFVLPDNPEERRLLFIAGGSGIAPLRAMLRHALDSPGRQIGLFYSARTSSEFAYEAELQTLAQTGRIELRQTVTREAADDWIGTRGRIGPTDLEPLVHGAETLCFVCGPPALVETVPAMLEGLGVPRSRVRVEEWGTA